MKRQIYAIARKEISNYFGSPVALIFLGTFVATALFIFFTIETFFAKGLADIRTLFQWIPFLLIFLVSGRYEASVINSYFDILVRYGDQDVVLNFADLIQIDQTAAGTA